MTTQNAWSYASSIEALRGGLIVSCQATQEEPMYGSGMMAHMALAAEMGGAHGIRANTPDDIAAIRAVTALPLIGLFKVDLVGFDVYITPRLEDALAVAAAGADIIAIDATNRPHPDGAAAVFIRMVKEATGKPVLADIATYEEAMDAAEAGADLVSTTLSGYTPESPQITGPDLNLVRRLAGKLPIPLIAEGRISTPEEARQALEAGADAVVVGAAITRPQVIARRFVEALRTPSADFAGD